MLFHVPIHVISSTPNCSKTAFMATRWIMQQFQRLETQECWWKNWELIFFFFPSKSATVCVQAILVISELCKDLWRGGGVSCIIQFQNKIRQHDRALAGYIARGGSGYMFCCTDSTMTRLMRHFQPAAVLTHPPRSAFLLPGNRGTLSLSSTMSVNAGWIMSRSYEEASRFRESHSKDKMGILH